jgi:hypothetical protein
MNRSCDQQAAQSELAGVAPPFASRAPGVRIAGKVSPVLWAKDPHMKLPHAPSNKPLKPRLISGVTIGRRRRTGR